MKTNLIQHATCLLLLAFATSAQAGALAVTTHTTLGSFNAAAGTLSTEALNGAPTGPFNDLSFTDFDIDKSDPFIGLAILPGGDTDNFDGSNFLNFTTLGAFGQGPVFTFGHNIQAFGFEYKNLDSSFDVIGLLVDGQEFEIAQAGETGFFGITTDGPFTTVRIIQQTGGDLENRGALFDNFQYTTVPEPTSLALLGLGGLLVARRRR